MLTRPTAPESMEEEEGLVGVFLEGQADEVVIDWRVGVVCGLGLLVVQSVAGRWARIGTRRAMGFFLSPVSIQSKVPVCLSSVGSVCLFVLL